MPLGVDLDRLLRKALVRALHPNADLSALQDSVGVDRLPILLLHVLVARLVLVALALLQACDLDLVERVLVPLALGTVVADLEVAPQSCEGVLSLRPARALAQNGCVRYSTRILGVA